VIRVLVTAESAIARAGLEALLRANPNIEVVDSAPDVVVAEVAGELPELAAGPVMVLLSNDPQPEWIREALRAGARAVLPADASGEEIVAAVEAAAAGLVAVDPRDLESLIGSALPAHREVTGADVQPLTSREIEVLRMIAEGHGNKTVAWKLGISEHTVKFHVGSIMSKLGASSRTEAVSIGIRRGLILL
jgi:NarL family two-component system response regulator YdfI